MKTKNIFKSLSALILIAAVFVSCEKSLSTEDISRLTYFPKFEKSGASLVLAPVGTAFVDPGIKATQNGEEIPVTMEIKGVYQGYSGTTVNKDAADKYLITYSATNTDGFVGTDSRTVYLAKTGDLVTSIEGLYTSTVKRTPAGTSYNNLKYILIYKTGANTYKMSDGIGGWYELGRALGESYRAPSATITAVNIPANNFTVSGTFDVKTFGFPCTMSDIVVDPTAKTIKYKTVWNNSPTVYTFEVTMTQVQI